jgi:hypothetical protein
MLLSQLPPGMQQAILHMVTWLDSNDPRSVEPLWLALATKLKADMHNSVAGQTGAFTRMNPRHFARWRDRLQGQRTVHAALR